MAVAFFVFLVLAIIAASLASLFLVRYRDFTERKDPTATIELGWAAFFQGMSIGLTLATIVFGFMWWL